MTVGDINADIARELLRMFARQPYMPAWREGRAAAVRFYMLGAVACAELRGDLDLAAHLAAVAPGAGDAVEATIAAKPE